MTTVCEACGVENDLLDVHCSGCGRAVASSGVHRMVGSVVLNHYEIYDVLGQGGMSVVYKARHQLTHQEVALKILPRELAAHSQVKGRFLEEARALAALDHPNIVHLYAFGEEDGCLVLAMQFIEGDTFERLIMDAGRLDWRVATRICIGVLDALDYAHQNGVIHRDMKPSNVLVRRDNGAATVMDFGIAKMRSSTRLTATGQTMGTVRYMSPEQVRGKPVDARTDIYSLGASLYEAVAGDTPFDGETHFEIMTKHLNEAVRPPSLTGVDLPSSLEEIILRSLAKRREDRFESARQFRESLQAVLNGRPAPTTLPARAPSGALPLQGATLDDRPNARSPLVGIASTLEPSEQSKRSRVWGPRLWIGLATVVVIGSAGVFAVLASGPPSESTAESPEAIADDDAMPEPHLVPGMTLVVDEYYPEERVRVLALREIDASAVVTTIRDARTQFMALLRARGLADEIPTRHLNVVLVPRRSICDPALYMPGDSTQGCAEQSSYYRPRARTLYVDQEQLGALPEDIALVLCIDAGYGRTVCGGALEEFLRDRVKPATAPGKNTRRGRRSTNRERNRSD